MSCSGSLKKGRFGYQWQVALALVGPIYDTLVESTIFPGIKRTHQSYQLLLGHLGMLWTQTEGVRLGI